MRKEISTLNKRLEELIFELRGRHVMIDRDLAEMYGVKAIALRQQVMRNRTRFPDDFMFRLTEKETRELITNCDRLSPLKFSPTSPYAFTQEGVAMLSSVLRSPRAIAVNIAIMRAFVRMKAMAIGYTSLAQRIDRLENRHDKQFKVVFDALRALMGRQLTPPKRIAGFAKE